MSVLKIAEFGNPIVRAVATKVTSRQIQSEEIQKLMTCVIYLSKSSWGVGLAAPQVGVPLALAIVELHNTPLREVEEDLSVVLINPVITNTFGRKLSLWEGCISSGSGSAGLFAKVPRYKKVEVEYLDENGVINNKIFKGLAAQVIQHEVDHLNGILFVDKVKDTTTYMTYSEYKKMKKREV